MGWVASAARVSLSITISGCGDGKSDVLDGASVKVDALQRERIGGLFSVIYHLIAIMRDGITDADGPQKSARSKKLQPFRCSRQALELPLTQPVDRCRFLVRPAIGPKSRFGNGE